jgi:hypothetical protein
MVYLNSREAIGISQRSRYSDVFVVGLRKR